MTSISIPSSVRSIERLSFGGCSGLTSVNISFGVTNIGYLAFLDCSNLMSVTIPSSVTNIASHALGYYRDENQWDQKIPNFIICSDSGSAAETYAKENGFTFETISENDLHWAEIVLEADSYEYDGKAKTPTVTAKFNGKTLALNTDYTVSYSNNIDIGTAKVTITGKGDYEGTVEKSFFIHTDMTKATVTLDESSYTYDGQAKIPSVIVKLGEKTLVLNTDYTVTYSDNINAGTAKVIVSGKAAYAGSIEKTFTISRADISKANITLDKTSYTYDGKAKTPSVTVNLDGKTLSLNTDYTVFYSDNTNVGTAKVTVTGKGNYTGSKTVNFTISKAGQDSSITCKKTLYKVAYGTKPFKIKATSKSKLTFTSSKTKIASVDKNNGKVTIKNTGVATITVKAGKDSVKITVKVSPKKQTVKSMKTSNGKKLTVKWAKDKTASGYQVQISTAKNFKRDVKSKNVSKTSYTFTKLKTGKKYYVRVRSYKKSGKEMLYGDWSKAKQSTKVKK